MSRYVYVCRCQRHEGPHRGHPVQHHPCPAGVQDRLRSAHLHQHLAAGPAPAAELAGAAPNRHLRQWRRVAGRLSHQPDLAAEPEHPQDHVSQPAGQPRLPQPGPTQGHEGWIPSARHADTNGHVHRPASAHGGARASGRHSSPLRPVTAGDGGGGLQDQPLRQATVLVCYTHLHGHEGDEEAQDHAVIHLQLDHRQLHVLPYG